MVQKDAGGLQAWNSRLYSLYQRPFCRYGSKDRQEKCRPSSDMELRTYRTCQRNFHSGKAFQLGEDIKSADNFIGRIKPNY